MNHWIPYTEFNKQRTEASAGGPGAATEFYNRYKGYKIHTGIHNGNEPCPTGYRDPAEPDVDWFCFCDDKEHLLKHRSEIKMRVNTLLNELKFIDKLLS